jgi:hypothetical protein
MRLLRDPDDAARALRTAAAALALAGVLLLLVATLAVVLRVHLPAVRADGRPVAATTLEATGWDRHGPALVLLALVALGLAGAALRGVRGTAAGLAGVGVAAPLVVLVGDLPDLHRAGALGEVYAGSVAGPGAGWYAESAGAVALVVAGGLLLGLATGAGAPLRDPAPGTAAGR